MITEFLEDCENSLSLGVMAWIAAIALNTSIHLNFTSKEDFIFGLCVTIAVFAYIRIHRWFMRGWASGRL